MCWNAEVSLNTFILGSIAAIIAIILNDYTNLIGDYNDLIISLIKY